MSFASWAKVELKEAGILQGMGDGLIFKCTSFEVSVVRVTDGKVNVIVSSSAWKEQLR